MKKTIRAILAVAGICVWGHAAHAAQPFMTVPSTGFDYASNGNDGFLFTPTSDLLVNALDYYVSPDAAVPYTLNNSHGVAIYDVAGSHVTPLVQAVLGPGGGTLVGGEPEIAISSPSPLSQHCSWRDISICCQVSKLSVTMRTAG